MSFLKLSLSAAVPEKKGHQPARFFCALVLIMVLLLTTGCSRGYISSYSDNTGRKGFALTSVYADYDGRLPLYAEGFGVPGEGSSADIGTVKACGLFDVDGGKTVIEENLTTRLYPASTTKIMTALVALDKGDLDAQTTVSKEAITFSESGVSTAKLKEGDVLTLRQLLYALLTMSANDAANVIAEQIAGSQDAFVEMMNQEAQKIGATNTHFVNANGLHSEDHYTTVYDLYLMFNAAMQHEEFLQMLQEKEYQASYQAADGTTVEAVWSTTNQFTKGDVTVPDGVTAVGGKTGTTTAAMSCLVQLFEDAQGEQYVAIILGCKERGILYQEMQTFLSNLNN